MPLPKDASHDFTPDEWRELIEKRKAAAYKNAGKGTDADFLLVAEAGRAIAELRSLLEQWDRQYTRDEAYWQTELQSRPILFSALFAFPLVVLQEKAYLGGKGLDNTGGALADFILANKLTRNVAVVEIKTPNLALLGPAYRGRVYAISHELTGAVVQTLDYRDGLTKEYTHLVHDSTQSFKVFFPQCIIIAGRYAEIDDRDKERSFELFRRSLTDVQIVTYDELFAKIELLTNLLLP